MGDLPSDSQNILSNWKNYFTQFLIMHKVRNVRQTEIRTAEPLLPNPSPFVIQVANANPKKCKSPGSDQILANLIHAGGETLLRYINLLTLSGIRKDCLIRGGSLLLYQFR
jgi:hypothetical protein